MSLTINNQLLTHRFLGVVSKKIDNGQFFFVMNGEEKFLNDHMCYNPVYVSQIKEQIHHFLTSKCDLIITIDKRKISFGNKQQAILFDSLIKNTVVLQDDLDDTPKVNKSIDEFIIYGDNAELNNHVQNITKAMDSLPTGKVGVIFNDFLSITNCFDGRPESEEVMNNSFLTWKNKKQYSFYLLNGKTIGGLHKYGVSDKHTGYVEITGPNIEEVKTSLKYFLRRNNKPIEELERLAGEMINSPEKPTLFQIINKITTGVETTYYTDLIKKLKPKNFMSDVILPKSVIEKIQIMYDNYRKGINNKGILFHGLPGTGKTMVAEALANSSNSYLKLTSISDYKMGFVGQSGQAVRAVFEECRKNGKSIIVIDEGDSIFPDRKKSRRNDSFTDDILNEFLTNLDGLKDDKSVFLIVTTNNPDLIDDAMRSRLETIYIPLPGEEEVKKLITKYLGAEYIHLAPKLVEIPGRYIRDIGYELKQGKPIDDLITKVITNEVAIQMARTGLANLEKPTRKFSDIFGYKNEKSQIIRKINKGVKTFLFHGPSGTGKTEFTRKMAAEMNFYYINISVNEILRRGLTFSKVFESLKLLTNISGVVINTDELDGLSQAGPTVRAEMLNEIDKINNMNNNKVYLTATTNFPDQLDESFRRRYKFNMIVPPMDETGVTELLNNLYPEYAEQFISNQLIFEELLGRPYYQIIDSIEKIIDDLSPIEEDTITIHNIVEAEPVVESVVEVIPEASVEVQPTPVVDTKKTKAKK